MVVDAVREPDSLHVNEEPVPLIRGSVAIERPDDVLQCGPDSEIVAVILIPDDVAAGQARLIEEVDELLLLQTQLVEGRDLVTQDPDVRKLLGLVLKGLPRLGLGRDRGGGGCAACEQAAQPHKNQNLVIV